MGRGRSRTDVRADPGKEPRRRQGSFLVGAVASIAGRLWCFSSSYRVIGFISQLTVAASAGLR